MKLVGIGRAQAELSGLVDRAQKERIILTRHGEPIAMLTGVKGRDLEELLLSQDPGFRNLIAQRRRDARPTVSHESLLAEATREHAGKSPKRPRRAKKGDAPVSFTQHLSSAPKGNLRLAKRGKPKLRNVDLD